MLSITRESRDLTLLKFFLTKKTTTILKLPQNLMEVDTHFFPPKRLISPN